MSMNFDQNSDWKGRVNGILATVHTEIKRTTTIGFKMINASRLTGDLDDCYQLLGKRLLEALENGELEWRDPKAKILITEIKELEQLLNSHEEDVQILKKK